MLSEHVKLFQEFAERLGIRDLELDESAFNLVISVEGKKFRLYPAEKNETIYCSRELCLLPAEPERELALLRYIAEENCFFKSTGEGVLGTHLGVLYFSARIPLQGATVRDLENLVDACFNLCTLLEKGCEAALNGEVSPTNDSVGNDANALFV